jgi:hemerythrin superfamily protein
MNALMLLKTDHKTVEALFKQFEKIGDNGASKKKALVQKIIKELAVHAAIEEQVFYPAVRKAVKKAEDDVLEALEEHHIVKWVLSELDGMDPEEERFDAKVTVLMENVRHHVKEEEQELFPEVKKKMSAKELTVLGGLMEKAKRTAPTRPHPRAPDTPPGNIVAGRGAALLDKAKDAASSLMKRATEGGGRTRTKQHNGHVAPRTGRAVGQGKRAQPHASPRH